MLHKMKQRKILYPILVAIACLGITAAPSLVKATTYLVVVLHTDYTDGTFTEQPFEDTRGTTIDQAMADCQDAAQSARGFSKDVRDVYCYVTEEQF